MGGAATVLAAVRLVLRSRMGLENSREERFNRVTRSFSCPYAVFGLSR